MSHVFRVWAPRPRNVDLVLEGRRLPMERWHDGWWSLDVAAAGPGTRYAFSLDGGPPRPDPRSASQPDGVDGSSQLVDHAAFAWTDQRWRGLPGAGALHYELHVGTFTPGGSFESAIERLPHLVELGVDVVELMPVIEFPGRRGWGYDGVALFAPHHAYGGPAGLKRFVDACHAAGLGVVLDVVYNHVGPYGNHLAEFGPYFSAQSTVWGQGFDFEGAGSREVRRFVIDNALGWLRDYHVDGLRLDAVHAIVDRSEPHVLEELAQEVRALAAFLRRPLFLEAECVTEEAQLLAAPEAGGFGLDGAWADEWHHALHALLTGERAGYYGRYGSVGWLALALRDGWVHDGAFRDRTRRPGAVRRAPAPCSYVVCAQNHDQVGNRARGERLAALVSPGRLRIAAALLLTGPFTPLLFQGEEWGAGTPFQYFTDHEDPDAAEAVTVGRRREFAAFGWDPDLVPDPQDPETFRRSRLDWTEPLRPPHDALLDWHRRLIALRRRVPELASGVRRADVRSHEQDGWLLLRRGRAHVAVNLSGETRTLRLPASRLLLASDEAVQLREHALVLPPESVAILLGSEA